MVQAYQAGVAALKLSLKDVMVESAENLVDQIQEVWRPLQTQRRHCAAFSAPRQRCSCSLVFCLRLPQLCDSQDDVNQTLSSLGAAGTLAPALKSYPPALSAAPCSGGAAC